MPSFTDTLGRTWRVELNHSLAKQVRSRLGVDLFGSDELPKLAFDMEQGVNVLWLLCEEQAKASNVDEECFGKGFSGQVYDAGVDALLEAVVDFCPSSRREAIRQAVARLQEVGRKMVAAAMEKLQSQETTTQIDKAVRETFTEAFGSLSTSARA